MRYTVYYNCGHPDIVRITGRDREARLAPEQERFGSRDCGMCAWRNGDTVQVRYARDLPRYGWTDHDRQIRVVIRPDAWHYTPYPGGGTWRDPGWEVIVEDLTYRCSVINRHPEMRQTGAYEYNPNGWLAPTGALLNEVLEKLTRRLLAERRQHRADLDTADEADEAEPGRLSDQHRKIAAILTQWVRTGKGKEISIRARLAQPDLFAKVIEAAAKDMRVPADPDVLEMKQTLHTDPEAGRVICYRVGQQFYRLLGQQEERDSSRVYAWVNGERVPIDDEDEDA